MCFPFNVNRTASSSSAAISRANKYHREDEYSSQKEIQGKRLIRETKHILMNVVEYFENETEEE